MRLSLVLNAGDSYFLPKELGYILSNDVCICFGEGLSSSTTNDFFKFKSILSFLICALGRVWYRR